MQHLSHFPNNNHTEYFVTESDLYITQYRNLVMESYKNDLELELNEDDWNLNKIKQSGTVFVAVNNGRVIGGGMLYISSSVESQRLPMEGGMRVIDQIYDYDFSHAKYAELGKLAVDKDYRSTEVAPYLIQTIIDYANDIGCSYLFVLAPRINSVLYRRVCKSIGLPITIQQEKDKMKFAAYEHLDMRYLSARMEDYHRKAPVMDLPVARKQINSELENAQLMDRLTA